MSTFCRAAPSVRNAIRNSRTSKPASHHARGIKNYPPGPTGNNYYGAQHGPSGDFPWLLGAVAFAVPAGVWLSASMAGKDRPAEVTLDSALDRLKATKHRDFESLSDRASQVAHDGQATINYMGNELRGKAGEHPHFAQERLNNERFKQSVDSRTGESQRSEKKSSWNLFDTLRGGAKRETGDMEKKTGDALRSAEHKAEEAAHVASDTLRATEDKAGDALRAAENKIGESWRTTEDKGEEALRLAEERSRSFVESLRNKTGESYEYVKDKAGGVEQSMYDAFNKPVDLPENVQKDIEKQRHSVWRRNPDQPETAHPAGSPHNSHSNIEHNTPHGGPYGTPGRHPRNFAEGIEGPPVDSPNKAPTVPNSDEHQITNAHHRRLYAKDAANIYPEKSRKGEGVLDTARLTEPVNSWTRPLRGGNNQKEPPKHN